MSNLKYPIFKLPEYYIREFEKRELPRYMKWWLYQSYLRKHGVKLSDILTGSNFTLENTVARKFNIFEVQGNTEQIQLSGKNLLINTAPSATTKNGITFTKNQDGTITANGTSTNVVTLDVGKPIVGNYKYSGCPNNGGFTNSYRIRVVNSQPPYTEYGTDIGTGVTINFNEVLESDTIRLHIDRGVTVNNLVFKPMISTNGGEYEPYCGGIPSPNPEYPQAIKNVTGNVNVKIENKNLWNNELETAEYNSQGEKITSVVWVVNTQKIKVKPNTTYSVSQKETPSQYRIIFFNGNNYLSKIDNTQNTTTGYSNYSFTTPTNCNYIYIQFRSTLEVIATGTYDMTPSDITEVQLEQSSTASSYVEHEEQNLPFTLAEGQRLMQGGSLQDDGIHNKRKQIVLKGTENVYVSGNYYYITINDKVSRTVLTKNKVLCSHFTETSGSSASGMSIGEFFESYYSSGNKNIMFNYDNGAGGVAGFKSYLAQQYANNTPVILEYELAEEEITPYTETQTTQYNAIQNAKTYNEQTNITTSSDELDPILKIQYYEIKEV